MRYDDIVALAGRLFLSVFFTTVAVAGYEPLLDRALIDDAIALGQSRSEAVRLRYHLPYRIHVSRAPVDYIDIVTPFRRLEMAVEDQARLGDRLFTQREAQAVLAEHGDRLTCYVELTFHPLNTFVGVPPYTVTLLSADAQARIDVEDVQRVPRYGARMEGLPIPLPAKPAAQGASEPVLGGTIVFSVGTRRLDPNGRYGILIEESGKELARGLVDLRALR